MSNPDVLLWRPAKQAKTRYKPQELKIQIVLVFAESNSNKLYCRRAKQAKNFQIVFVLPIQILIYYCVANEARSKFQIVFVLLSQILIYYCVGERSKLKNSNSTCFTKSNSNILMCRQAKQAKNFK